MLVRWSKWIGFKKLTLKKKLEIFQEVGYPVPFGTFRNWRRKFENYGSAEVPQGKVGRPELLDPVEKDIFSGKILHEADLGINLSQSDLSVFIEEHFGYVCSPQTAGNYARQLGFSFRDFRKGTTSGKFSDDDLVEMAYAWLAKRRLRHADPSKVCCIDFTFTSHRKDRARGYSRAGKKAPAKGSHPTRYTNLIVCASFADGKNHAPPMMFTYNPAFDKCRGSTEIREGQRQKIAQTLKEVECFGVQRDDIRYVPPPINKKKKVYTYVGERQDLLEVFLKERGIDESTFIFHDAGSVFGPKDSSVLKRLGYENEITFEPAVHQFLSTCDNDWFGRAKRKWREKFKDFDDDISTSIWLLAFLRDTYSGVEKRFKDNLLLGIKRLKEEDVERLIRDRKESRRINDEELKTIYRTFMGMDGRGIDRKRKGDPLITDLDGAYHNVKRSRKK